MPFSLPRVSRQSEEPLEIHFVVVAQIQHVSGGIITVLFRILFCMSSVTVLRSVMLTHFFFFQTLIPVLEDITCTLHILCPLLFILDALIQDDLLASSAFPIASISIAAELFSDFFPQPKTPKALRNWTPKHRENLILSFFTSFLT